MERKLSRNSLLSVPFLAVLIASIAISALAQTRGAGQQAAKLPFVSGRPAPAQPQPPLHFAKPVSYDPGGTNPSSIAVADINGDGHLDLVIAYWSEGNVGVLLGKGDGTFQPAVKSATGGSYAYSVAVADVNGDGKLDIVVLNTWNNPGTVSVLLGNGDGTFQPPTTYYTGDYSIPEAVAVGDLNGDGHPDIAIANFGHRDCDCNDGQIGVLWGNGDGTFQPIVFYHSGGYDTVSISFVDGAPLVINLCQEHYCDWPNGSVCWHGCYDSGGQNPYFAAVGDLNGDGVPDIVASNQIANPNHDRSMTLAVLFPYQDAVLYYPGGSYPGFVVIADLDGDGKADVVVQTSSGVGVLLGNGDGTLQPAITFAGSMAALADVNGDGKPDLISFGSIMLNASGFPSTTHLTSSLNPSFVDQQVTFTATVTSKAGAARDGDLVRFYTGTTVLASVPLAGGTATYTTSSLPSRNQLITAAYVGDHLLAPSKGAIHQQILRYPTNTALTSAPNPSAYGQPVTFTATIKSAGPAPTGKVKFFDNGGIVIGTGTVNGGVCTLTDSRLLVGKHPITAEYLGDSANAKSTSPVLNQVVQ